MSFLSDRVRFGIIIPLCISITGGFLFLLQLSNSAAGVLTYVGHFGAGIFVVSSLGLMNSLMMKCVPLQNKGTLLGIFWWFGALGNLVSSKVGGELFDMNKDLPFIGIAILCWVYAAVVGTLALFGAFTH